MSIDLSNIDTNYNALPTLSLSPISSESDAYLEENEVSVVSASAKAYEFLVDKFGDKADAIFNHTLNSDGKGNKWMWKYTSFSAIVRDYKRKTGTKCRRIISIGDGSDEEKAARHYSKTHNVEALHIRLLRGPTIIQLQQQWQYIQWKLYGTIIDNEDEIVHQLCDNRTYKDADEECPDFHAFDLRKLFDTDNSNGLTGKMHQIPAIEKYFGLWMSLVIIPYIFNVIPDIIYFGTINRSNHAEIETKCDLSCFVMFYLLHTNWTIILMEIQSSFQI